MALQEDKTKDKKNEWRYNHYRDKINLQYKMRMIKTLSKYIICYVTAGVSLLNVWYTETFHAVMIGIRVYESKKFYNVVLCSYKIVEEGGKTEVCILIVLLSCFI